MGFVGFFQNIAKDGTWAFEYLSFFVNSCQNNIGLLKIVVKIVFGLCKIGVKLIFGLYKIGAKLVFGLYKNRCQISIWAL